MVAGDVEGRLIFYEVKGPQARYCRAGLWSKIRMTLLSSLFVLYRTVETARGAVKKLRFAPGKGNTKMFVLYNVRIDIRDAVGVSRLPNHSTFIFSSSYMSFIQSNDLKLVT